MSKVRRIARPYCHDNHSAYSQWNECICDMLDFFFYLYYCPSILVLLEVSFFHSCNMFGMNFMKEFFGTSWTKVSLFFSFWNYILFCVLLQMLTPTHVYISLPSFSQYESEFDDDKDIKPVYKKKKKCCSKQNLCFYQHLLYLLWFTCFVTAKCKAGSWKRKRLVF